MREKSCEICQEQFTYKNKSKKYCSNACKQQALRNRKKKSVRNVVYANQNKDILKQQIPLNNNPENSQLISVLFNKCVKQIETFCKGISIHYSTIIFLKDTVQALRVSTPPDSILKTQFEHLNGVLKSLYEITEKHRCEYGYITFNRYTTKRVAETLNQIKKLDQKQS